MKNRKKLKVRKTVLKKRKNIKAGDDDRRCCNINDFNWNIFKRKTPIVQARFPSTDSDGLFQCPYDERYLPNPGDGIPIGKPVSNSSQEVHIARPVRPLPVVRAISKVSSNEFGPYKMAYGVKKTQKKKTNRKKKDNKRKKKYITRRPKRSRRVKKTRNNIKKSFRKK